MLADGLAAPDGTQVQLGLRPEDVRLHAEPHPDGLPLRVLRREFLGAGALLHLQASGLEAPLVASLPPARAAAHEPGHVLHLAAAPGSVLVFAADGARLPRRARRSRCRVAMPRRAAPPAGAARPQRGAGGLGAGPPALLLMAVLLVAPTLAVLALSFTDAELGVPDVHLLGWSAYADLLTDRDFLRACRNTAVYVAIVDPAAVALGLGAALLIEAETGCAAVSHRLFPAGGVADRGDGDGLAIPDESHHRAAEPAAAGGGPAGGELAGHRATTCWRRWR